jgi:hypothetical protein
MVADNTGEKDGFTAPGREYRQDVKDYLPGGIYITPELGLVRTEDHTRRLRPLHVLQVRRVGLTLGDGLHIERRISIP